MNAILAHDREAALGDARNVAQLHREGNRPGPLAGVPVVVKEKDRYALDWKRPKSIGKLQAFYGNFGMLVRAYRFLQDNPDPNEEEVRAGMSGNLCRCTGYQNIVKAVMHAAAVLRSAQKETA